MKKARLTFLKLAVAAAIATCVSVGSASAQSLKATFNLPYEVSWGKAVLQPGPYIISFDTAQGPALVRTRTGRGVALVRANNVTPAMKDQPSALLITRTETGHVVRSLNIREADMSFVYKPFTKSERKLLGQVEVIEALPILMAQK
jgi:hypothetical protein